MRTIRRAMAGAGTAAVLLAGTAAPALAQDRAPRPGCGYGDDRHAHQAAPGRDPLNLRPGEGSGDANHPHTLPPGQAEPGQGDQSAPMRGCRAEPGSG